MEGMEGLKGMTVLEQWPNPNLQKELIRQNLGIQRNAGGRKVEWSKKLPNCRVAQRKPGDLRSFEHHLDWKSALNSQIPLIWCPFIALASYLQLELPGICAELWQNSKACLKWCEVTWSVTILMWRWSLTIVQSPTELFTGVAQQNLNQSWDEPGITISSLCWKPQWIFFHNELVWFRP